MGSSGLDFANFVVNVKVLPTRNTRVDLFNLTAPPSTRIRSCHRAAVYASSSAAAAFIVIHPLELLTPILCSRFTRDRVALACAAGVKSATSLTSSFSVLVAVVVTANSASASRAFAASRA
jgi:hypothetical protein